MLRLTHIVLILTLALPWQALGAHILPAQATTAENSGIYRVQLLLKDSYARQRLDKLGIKVLEETATSASVLVSGDQLETLARLRYQPTQANDLALMVSRANSQMQQTFRPLISQSVGLSTKVEQSLLGDSADTPKSQFNRESLHALISSFTVEQLTQVSTLPGVDEDADGLTNTEEMWWCTNPLNPNTDGDVQGYTDGQEVAALLDFTLPRSVRWGYGAPFGPPNAWPAFNQPGGCNDGDFDTIPDFAEVFMVGSRVPAESTDLDKFDDGQELFGITYCSGAPVSCGYGNYPRIEYWNYIQASMPDWVEPPGDNLFVAAFPIPEISVIPGTWRVERVTTITTQQGQMVQNEHTYETSATRGQSSSIAKTVTWNNWEEISKSVETPLQDIPLSIENDDNPRNQRNGWGLLLNGAVISATGAVCLTVAGCAPAIAILGIGGGAAMTFIGENMLSSTPDYSQELNNIGKYTADIANGINTSNQNLLKINSTVEQGFQSLGEKVDTGFSQLSNTNAAGFNQVSGSLDNINYTLGEQNKILAYGLYDISYQISRPRLTETRTSGYSWGGAQTTTHEKFESHTITAGEAFTTGENWSTAWAVDSSHAANLTFNFIVSNSGSDYAREVTGMIVNIYLGDDKTPIISYPAWEKFPNGAIQNLFPGKTHTFASSPIALTLEQMKRIDLGERLTIVMEDFSYGADELFYQGATSGGITVYIEDGVEDGDELVDCYVIPTWGTESLQDVLTRFFPYGLDENGNINSLWTPEFNGINPLKWKEYYLSDIAWWNIYLSNPDMGNTSLNQIAAQAGSAMLFRFNRDSDRDGYQDRVEMHYGTKIDDPTSHPQPKIFAGFVENKVGNKITVTLKLANSGTFDAYGIDAVMYAPDNSVSILNNIVGGNGRVRAGQEVAVGSVIDQPDLTNWTSSTAHPYVIGNYLGSVDKTYTFSVTTPGVIGSGTTTLSWNDGLGGTGTLNLGVDYHAPLPVVVGDGIEVGFDTGTVMAGQSFTTKAHIPGDTFIYQINSETYTQPVIVVSYSDPQGNHRFITPVQINNIKDDLAPHMDDMLPGIGIQISTAAVVDPVGNNYTSFIIDSPHWQTISGGHIYLNFYSNGELLSSVPYTKTFEQGPTIHDVGWSTALFNKPYNPDADNILVAFLTDYQGNIIDSAARPLSSFQVDPKPAFDMAASDQSWNFGSVMQGTLLKKQVTLANTGRMGLLTYISPSSSIQLSQTGSRTISAGDFTTYELTLDTRSLAPGPFAQDIPIRTSDPANPSPVIHVTGTITAASGNVLSSTADPYQPWQTTLFFPSARAAGESVTFDPRVMATNGIVTPLYYQDPAGTELGHGRDISEWDGTGHVEQVANGGFETGSTTGWTASSGVWSAITNEKHAGGYSAQPVQQNNHNPVLMQEVSLAAFKDWITQGFGNISLGAWLKPGAQKGRIQFVFLKPDANEIGHQDSGWLASNGNWQSFFTSLQIPATTDRVRIILEAEWSLTDTGWIELLGPGTNNGGFEDGLTGWIQYLGSVNITNQYPHSGTYNISSAVNANPTSIYKDIDVSQYRSWIDAGYGTAEYGAWQATADSENARFLTRFYQGAGNSFTYDSGWTKIGSHHSFAYLGQTSVIPVGTDKIRIEIMCQRSEGSSCDNHVDDATLRVRFTPPGASNSFFDDISVQLFSLFNIERISESNSRLILPDIIANGDVRSIQYGLKQEYSEAGVRDFSIRLPKRNYQSVILQAALRDPSGDRTTTQVRLDVGANGSYEWQAPGFPIFPGVLTTNNLAGAFSAYLATATAGPDGMVEIPIRAELASGGVLFLTNLVATPGGATDLAVSAGDLHLPATSPVETDQVNIGATLHNPGAFNSGPVTASFFATLPGWGDWYLGSAYLANIPGGGSAQAAITWDTLGFDGNLPVKVVLDPYNRVAESDESNNQATANLLIKTRADLLAQVTYPAPLEFVKDQPSSLTLSYQNAGQTNAPASVLAVYDGDPNAGGVLIAQPSAAVTANGQQTLSIPWTPSVSGPHRLFLLADHANQVSEANKANNTAWADVYVGLKDPVLLDSGSASNDPVYTPALGYGAVDTGQADNVITCSGGLQSENTIRQDPTGSVLYRFDHLLPSQYYHLDVTLFECDGAGRQESIYVGNTQIDGPVDLGDGKIHHLSYRLDPALYKGHTIEVSVSAPGIDGAVVSEVNLHAVDYRYIDAGADTALAYTAERGSGWLNGTVSTAWGTLPYQSVRVDQTSNALRYRFDRLSPSKRYNLHFTFWQPSGTGRIQKVQVDGVDTNLNINLGDFQIHHEQALLPLSTYAADGSIEVTILRTNASTGAMVNEIALEEETISTQAECVARETPYSTLVYGAALIQGQAAPVGTLIQALSPRGDTVGCFTVTQAGQYGFMHIYGEDATATPAIPGMRSGESVSFRINGAPALPTPLLYWQNDLANHKVDLNGSTISGQSILLKPGWNLVSFKLEPTDPLVRAVLGAIAGLYDRVLGETGIFSPTLPDAFNTLRELHGFKGYYLRASSSTSVNLLVEGIQMACDTPVTLHQGWNWIGAPCIATPVASALAGISGKYLRVLSLDKVYDPALPAYSTLTELKPGEGYLLYATTPVTLQYPATSADASPAPDAPTGCAVSPTPFFSLYYGTVTRHGAALPAGTRVEALTPAGEVAGCAMVTEGGKLPITMVYGSPSGEEGGYRPGQALSWRVNGISVQIGQAYTWQDDKELHPITLEGGDRRFYVPVLQR